MGPYLRYSIGTSNPTQWERDRENELSEKTEKRQTRDALRTDMPRGRSQREACSSRRGRRSQSRKTYVAIDHIRQAARVLAANHELSDLQIQLFSSWTPATAAHLACRTPRGTPPSKSKRLARTRVSPANHLRLHRVLHAAKQRAHAANTPLPPAARVCRATGQEATTALQRAGSGSEPDTTTGGSNLQAGVRSSRHHI
jgi:hypothetical protein